VVGTCIRNDILCECACDTNHSFSGFNCSTDAGKACDSTTSILAFFCAGCWAACGVEGGVGVNVGVVVATPCEGGGGYCVVIGVGRDVGACVCDCACGGYSGGGCVCGCI
jgi:hypothetical protein